MSDSSGCVAYGRHVDVYAKAARLLPPGAVLLSRYIVLQYLATWPTYVLPNIRTTCTGKLEHPGTLADTRRQDRSVVGFNGNTLDIWTEHF